MSPTVVDWVVSDARSGARMKEPPDLDSLVGPELQRLGGPGATGLEIADAWMQVQPVYRLIRDLRASLPTEGSMDWCQALVDAVPLREPRNGFENSLQSVRRACVAVLANPAWTQPADSPFRDLSESDSREFQLFQLQTNPKFVLKIPGRTWLGRLIDRVRGE
jgi:hypothetical protein